MAQIQPVYEAEVRRGVPSLAVFSLWFGALMILFSAVTHLAIGEQNQAWMEPFANGLRFTLLALMLASIGFLIANAGDGLKTAVMPLFINLGTVIILLFVPFDSLWDQLSYRWQIPYYKQVASMVESGAVLPDVTGTAVLPVNYDHLTENGRIQIMQKEEATEILFITEQQDHFFAGYLYISDNTPPQTGDFNGQWRMIVQKQANWFYVLSDQ